MAVKVIGNACIAGALAGLMQGKFIGSFTATDYVNIKNAAAAIGAEFLARNTASGAAMADADNTEIGYVVFGASFAAVQGQSLPVSTAPGPSAVAADYIVIANQIYASAKETLLALA